MIIGEEAIAPIQAESQALLKQLSKEPQNEHDSPIDDAASVLYYKCVN